jgi:glucose-6-phosphate-specific signal transduction histidine kinase
LIGMRERAFALGGSLTITGAHEKGTTIVLNIPLKEADKKPHNMRRQLKNHSKER